METSGSEVSRTAVVTGGGSGMGTAICHHLARQGRKVAVLDVNGDAAERVAKEVEAEGFAALGVPVDVSDRSAVEAALDQVRQSLGRVEIMVTSAGIEGFVDFLDISVEDWERMMAVNLTGTFHCLQAAVPDMIEAGWGRIVTISSSSAQSGTRRMSHYVASKGGVIALTKALALDLAPKGITVNTIPPGVIDTPMMRRPIESGAMASMDAILARAPLGTGRHARRHRRGLRLPLLRGGGVHHRPADQRERRLVSVSALATRPLGSVGAEVLGIEPDRLLATTTNSRLPPWQALEENGVLVFRELHLDDETQVAFSKKLDDVGKAEPAPAPSIYKVTLDPDEDGHGRVPQGHRLLAHRRRPGRGADQGDDAQRPRAVQLAAARPSSPAPTPPTTT